MRFVICKHPKCDTAYLFTVPETTFIDAGDYLIVETKHGKQLAQAVSDSFLSDPEIICPLWNTTEKAMKRVLMKLLAIDVVWPVQVTAEQIENAVNATNQT